MNYKVVNLKLLINKLNSKYNQKFKYEFSDFERSYNFMFIHSFKYLIIDMEDYDGWDNFGGEDNELYIYINNNDNYIYDTNDNMNISHSIKEKYICEYNGDKYILYDAIKDWCIFKDININDICYDLELEMMSSIELTETEIDIILTSLNNTNQNELISKLIDIKSNINYMYKDLELNQIYENKFNINLKKSDNIKGINQNTHQINNNDYFDL